LKTGQFWVDATSLPDLSLSEIWTYAETHSSPTRRAHVAGFIRHATIPAICRKLTQLERKAALPRAIRDRAAALGIEIEIEQYGRAATDGPIGKFDDGGQKIEDGRSSCIPLNENRSLTVAARFSTGGSLGIACNSRPFRAR
jgi:hypothetical protein